MSRLHRHLVVLLIVAGAAACASSGKEDPIAVLASAEALERGRELMEQEKYRQARDYLTHAFEVEPNSVGGREALLLAADAYFLQGGIDNYIRAESRYRDFQTRFPTSPRAAYVQFQIAASLAKRLLRPDRDQANSRKAIEEFEAVVTLYPTSEYVAEARQEIRRVRQYLAGHEMHVGNFYYRYGNLNGATARLEHILEEYPDYEELDRALFVLGLTYRKSDREEDARRVWDRLESEYPDSEYVKQIPRSPSS